MGDLYFIVQLAVTLIGSVGTIWGAVYAVRWEVRKRVDSLNQQVIELQDRKIKLLTDQLASANARIGELEGTVATLLRKDHRRVVRDGGLT